MNETAEQVFHYCYDRLQKAVNPREAHNISSMLLGDRFGITRMDVMLKNSTALDQKELDECIDRLLNSEPIQHVTGVGHFLGEKFLVNEHVLIPRPETEELVEWIISDHPENEEVIWDLGAGSGCISIGLSMALKKAQVFGFDVSREALEVARKNNLTLGACVQFDEFDIFKGVPKGPTPTVIVSNPPYIPETELSQMDANVVNYEPHVALFVPDRDPLLFYRRIAEIGLKVLSKNGLIYFEIHENLGEEVCALLAELGYSVELRKDLQGKNRMVKAKFFFENRFVIPE